MKIQKLSVLKALIGERPRAKSVILANGVFDIVHPGHVRHLRYAKSKADILVVSLTADRHIVKADYRPYIPEQLRADNLAELQCVDYVLIDEHASALETIAALQPDFYCKGYEYGSQAIPEVEAVESYGGRVIFTPGDVVFSSSHIIEHERPNLGLEKLLALMKHEDITFEMLDDAVRMFGILGEHGQAPLKVHVVGDTIVDAHTYCTSIGGQTKTPTLSVRKEGEQWFVGGAGVVAKHLKAAGADVTFSTVLGDDDWQGQFAYDDLTAAGITLQNVNAKGVTTFKNAVIADGYRLLKVDTVDNATIGPDIVRQLQEQINGSGQICVFADFRHGMFNKDTIPSLCDAIPKRCFRAVDSQVASRWGNITEFRGFDLATPNEREARFALGDQDSIVRALVLALAKHTQAKTLILKLGERGSLTYAKPQRFYALDSFARQAVDPVGAGDALLAYSTLALYATGNPLIAAVLGNLAAALECEREGNIPVTAAEVRDRIGQLEKAADYELPDRAKA